MSMSWSGLLLVVVISHCLLCGICVYPKSGVDSTMEFDLGKAHGLTSQSEISHDMMARIQSGAENGNKDNIYFLGLLKLYGVSLTKNEIEALANFKKAANLGLAEAMTACGMCAYRGIGMKKDNVAAITWFRKASNAKDVNAYWLLAKMLMEGEGVPYPQHPEAAAYFKMAAQERIPQAEHHLGIMYEYGLGVEKSFTKAAEYYTYATEKQFTESMYHLGLMYAHGRAGFPQDYKRAYPLFEAAAKSGHAPSTYSIGIFKTYGYGMEPNYAQAINWFERASVMGDDRVSEVAANAARELRILQEQAIEENEATLERYRLMSTEDSADVDDLDEDELTKW
jgi:TPR repeat protein